MAERGSRALVLALVVVGLAAGAAVSWRALSPRPPEALYRVRCSSCHALVDLCAYPTEVRAEIVRVMRIRRGADAVIDGVEAVAISRYLREELPCR